MITETQAGEKPLLRVRGLKVHFPIRGGLLGRPVGSIKAVDGVDFEILAGETFGLVGESGCGKSTIGNAVLRMVEPTAGSVEYDGRLMSSDDPKSLTKIRRDMQIIFQDPVSSLNPKLPVGKSVGEPLFVHRHLRGRELEREVADLFELVGLPREHLVRYPHEFLRRASARGWSSPGPWPCGPG